MTALGGEALDAAAEDRALLARLRAGEDAAFGELFARHSSAVRRLAFGLASDRAEAEDITAEAFFRVLQAIRRGSGPVDNVRGYLLIVARRVAWEWRVRHRDVPVSEEELTNHAGASPDDNGASTERNLITRAFTSLPERWRRVLWKVEVEGERPAVVALNFGLSPNATAALARRARQGLRAAYLQAHLAADRSSAGCRSVLEKLGAYTAGSITGTERRRIRAHLVGCASCTGMHAELRDVCCGLRAHAGLAAAPLAVVAGWELVTTGGTAAGTVGATVNGLLAGVKVQVAVAASAAAAAGVLGVAAGPWGHIGDASAVSDDLEGKRGVELIITGPRPGPSSTVSIVLPTGALSTAITPRRVTDDGSPAVPAPRAAAPQEQPAGRGAPGEQVLARHDGYNGSSPGTHQPNALERRSEQPDFTLGEDTAPVTDGGRSATDTATTGTRPAGPTSSTRGDPQSDTSTPESVRPTSNMGAPTSRPTP